MEISSCYASAQTCSIIHHHSGKRVHIRLSCSFSQELQIRHRWSSQCPIIQLPTSDYAIPLILFYKNHLLWNSDLHFKKNITVNISKLPPKKTGQRLLWDSVIDTIKTTIFDDEYHNSDQILNSDWVVGFDGGHKHSGTFAYTIAINDKNRSTNYPSQRWRHCICSPVQHELISSQINGSLTWIDGLCPHLQQDHGITTWDHHWNIQISNPGPFLQQEQVHDKTSQQMAQLRPFLSKSMHQS